MNQKDLDFDVYDAICATWPKLPRTAHRMAMALAQHSPAYLSAAAGNETIAVGEVLHFLRTSDMRAVLGDKLLGAAQDDIAAMAARLPPEQAMKLARERGSSDGAATSTPRGLDS